MIARNGDPQLATIPYPLVRVHKGKSMRIKICCDDYASVWTHWYASKTVECPGEEVCRCCWHGDAARFQGYLLATAWDTARVAVVHITALAAYELVAQMQSFGGALGLRCILTRGDDKDNARLSLKVVGKDPCVKRIEFEKLENVVRAIYRKNGKAPPVTEPNIQR